MHDVVQPTARAAASQTQVAAPGDPATAAHSSKSMQVLESESRTNSVPVPEGHEQVKVPTSSVHVGMHPTAAVAASQVQSCWPVVHSRISVQVTPVASRANPAEQPQVWEPTVLVQVTRQGAAHATQRLEPSVHSFLSMQVKPSASRVKPSEQAQVKEPSVLVQVYVQPSAAKPAAQLQAPSPRAHSSASSQSKRVAVSWVPVGHEQS